MQATHLEAALQPAYQARQQSRLDPAGASPAIQRQKCGSSLLQQCTHYDHVCEGPGMIGGLNSLQAGAFFCFKEMVGHNREMHRHWSQQSRDQHQTHIQLHAAPLACEGNCGYINVCTRVKGHKLFKSRLDTPSGWSMTMLRQVCGHGTNSTILVEKEHD